MASGNRGGIRVLSGPDLSERWVGAASPAMVARPVVPPARFAYEEPLRRCCEDRMSEERAATKTVSACVLIIGNEILSGRTQDANLAFLAAGLNEVGVRLREARVIADDR